MALLRCRAPQAKRGTGETDAYSLVEDNRDILANLADYLGMKGYTVDCAQDGLSGLHLAATEHYDLIVLDIMLPGIDGYTCASACAKTPAATRR
jgi:DNA-binding response OmpR family regulator